MQTRCACFVSALSRAEILELTKVVHKTKMNLADLPDDCIAAIISHTTPFDATRLARVCWAFKRAVEIDTAWENFLPSDYESMCNKSWAEEEESSSRRRRSRSKKDIVMTMTKGLFLDQGFQKYVLLRRTRGVCRVLSVAAMNVAWGQDTRFWRWEQSRSSCFGKVAHLLAVCWLEISGQWSCSLPPGSYTAVWRLRITNPQGGRMYFLSWKLPLTFCISVGDDDDGEDSAVERELSLSQIPSGGFEEWFEFAVGDIVIHPGVATSTTAKQVCVAYSIRETDCTYWKGGLFVDWLTLRPSGCKEAVQPKLHDMELSKIRGRPGVF